MAQNFEFKFCEARQVPLVRLYPAHSGHAIQQATLQYMDDASGAWVTAAESPQPASWTGDGCIVNTDGTNAMTITNTGTVAATRWRIYDFTSLGFQIVARTELFTSGSCS